MLVCEKIVILNKVVDKKNIKLKNIGRKQ